MTTRLLGQWAFLLSRFPQTYASAAHLRAPAALPVEPLWSQAWIQTPVRPLTGRENAQKNSPKICYKNTSNEMLVKQAKTPEEVLQLWHSVGGSSSQAAQCLIKLSKLTVESGVNTASILKNPHFEDMLKAMNSQVSMIWNSSLVALPRALCDLGVPSYSKELKSLQKEILWRLRRLNPRNLSSLVNWAYGRAEYKVENDALTSAALRQLELRWTELNDPKLLCVLMRRTGSHSPLLMDKLEEKALELAEKFTARDIHTILLVLASQKRRAVALLRALSYHLNQKPSTELKTPLLLDIAYVYGKLNFQHTPGLQKISSELFARLQELTPTEISRCSKSLAFLKWLHQPLFEGFAQNFLSESENYNAQQLCNLLLSFAKLNFQPCNDEKFYQRVHEALKSSWEELEPFLQTDVVWALCVLQQAKPEHIDAVTNPAFQTKLADGSPERIEAYRLKLLHIAASSQLESLGATSVRPTIHLPAPQVKTPTVFSLQSSLCAALQSLTMSCPTALRTDVNTVYGWTVDAELVVDSENKPIDLQNLVAPHLPGGGGSDELPLGAHRVAFLVWEFNHFLFNSKDLLGRYAMQKRHLQLAGFLVVEVPYFEWQELTSDWKKVAYLKDNIGKVVAENLAK